ncbi:hypothetical protein [Paraliobacillus sediminis]|uniref:hypothetical protein n=1 Tax=Paraliobacillus sediminis TaxID=1885916 RepID=UPI0013C336BC|nr:hypothetical protein [Paraliobacillus sediminis]
MIMTVLTIVAIYIVLYCINYSRIVIKDGNKLGGFAIICLIPFIIAGPILHYIMG